VYGLIALNCWMFSREWNAPDPAAYIDALAAIPFNITNHITLPPPSPAIPLVTLVTSLFIHAGLVHILFNMLFLLVFGPAIEYLCGHLRFLVFYLVCGICGGVAMITTGPGSHVPDIGASGAIAGVLGAFIVSFPRDEISAIVPPGWLPRGFRLPAFVVIGAWAISQFVAGFGALADKASDTTSGTAYFAHIGGFCAGVILVGLFRIRSAAARRFRLYW
jgi:membrane associated rhomboid family serine protease